MDKNERRHPETVEFWKAEVDKWKQISKTILWVFLLLFATQGAVILAILF